MTNLQLDQASKQATYNKGYANSEEVRIGFMCGARWHESLPLADRLSESEKEKIRKFYHTIWGKGLNKLQHELSEIFGKTLFTPTEQ